ncbi:MAG: hypothetical protein LBQ87_05580 [Candidatus Fibromonas sp.]|jgi:uncharacterized protein (TIGR02145 family)|nr:hypothetical protein [Candidatus Fibromonas sp.]
MKKYLGFAAVSVFLLSCADYNTERDNPYDMWAVNYIGNSSAEGSSSSVWTYEEPSSSSAKPSSSSVESSPSSSSSSSVVSQSGVIYGSSVTYGGETYQTVVIGTQTWFARNLNYDPGSGTSACYNNQPSYCNDYGRLYNWETAKTVCPSGWHLPNQAEWDVLGDDARKLRSTSGWNNNGNGTNDYGFSALPGGSGYSDGSFDGVGDYGQWWSASEGGSDTAYSQNMNCCDYLVAGWDYYYGKSSLFSVRCVQD